MKILKLFVILYLFASGSLLAQRQGLTASFGDSLKIFNAFSFSPDGKKLYTSERILSHYNNGRPVYKTWGSGRPQITLYEYDLEDYKLSNKHQLSFANDSLDSTPHLNFSGTRLYFNSRRAIPGSDTLDGKLHIWFSEKTKDGWTEAQYLQEVNFPGFHSAYAQELVDGSLVYQSNMSGSIPGTDGVSSLDFWKSELKNGVFQKPVNVSALNSAFHEDQLVIDKTGKTIIFTRVEGNEIEPYISIMENGQWRNPRKLLLTSVPGFTEQSPRLSSDGKIFFFAHGSLVMHISLQELLTEEEIEILR